DLMPVVTQPQARAYVDAIRVYLGLCAGTISLEDAAKASALIRAVLHSGFPLDISLLPVNERLKSRLLENVNTLRKYGLASPDSVAAAVQFAFIQDDSPMGPNELSVLRALARDPLISIRQLAYKLKMRGSKIARSIRNIEERNGVRFGCHLDASAFGLDSYILFFRMRERKQRELVQSALARFPFTKAVVTTATSDTGYASLLFPSDRRALAMLQSSTRKLTDGPLLSASLHKQLAAGSASNVEFYDGRTWSCPEGLKDILEGGENVAHIEGAPLLRCRGYEEHFDIMDLAVAAQLKSACRDGPEMIANRLKARGFQVDSAQVRRSIEWLKKRKLILPTIHLGGVGLNAHFCFEIKCDPEIRRRVITAMTLVPAATYYVSQQGVIVWIDVPSIKQVEYYRAFTDLRHLSGVESVNSMMTLTPAGSRSILDLVSRWEEGIGWTFDPAEFDLYQLVNESVQSGV
ncbi:MAG: hypothetical protein QXS20_10595, partial [Candidatus Thorarchaeota archaeon]